MKSPGKVGETAENGTATPQRLSICALWVLGFLIPTVQASFVSF